MESRDIMNIAIKDLTLAEWDARIRPEDPAELQALAESIKGVGFLNPLTAVKVGNKYRIIAGRRRLEAAKILGLKDVPVYVYPSVLSEKAVTLIENLARKDLNSEEQTIGTIEVYESEGYTKEQAFHGVRAIDNFYYNHKDGGNFDWKEFDRVRRSAPNSRQAGGSETNTTIQDEKFITLCRTIPLTPRYQYQLLQWKVQIDPKVQKVGQNLPMYVKTLLTKKALREHPNVQKQLIQELKQKEHRGYDSAKQLINQTCMDLQTGYSGGKKQKVGRDDKVDEPAILRTAKMQEILKKLMFRATGHKLHQGEFQYTENHIKNTKHFRLEMVKAAVNENAIRLLENELVLHKIWIDETLLMIDEELQSRKMKSGIITK